MSGKTLIVAYQCSRLQQSSADDVEAASWVPRYCAGPVINDASYVNEILSSTSMTRRISLVRRPAGIGIGIEGSRLYTNFLRVSASPIGRSHRIDKQRTIPLADLSHYRPKKMI